MERKSDEATKPYQKYTKVKKYKRKRTTRIRKRKERRRQTYRRRSYKLKRKNYGWYRRKFNIVLNTLKPFEQRVLLENPLLKYSADDDQFILILFRLYDMQRLGKHYGKFYINPYVNNVTTFKEIKKASKFINWKCAICKTPIKSHIDSFDIENFLCNICVETHSKTQFIDDRILHSSLKFRKACEYLYKHQTEVHREFIRKSEKGNH